jgi:hypothetical protein
MLAAVDDGLEQLDRMAEQLQRLLEQRRLEHGVADLPAWPVRSRAN